MNQNLQNIVLEKGLFSQQEIVMLLFFSELYPLKEKMPAEKMSYIMEMINVINVGRFSFQNLEIILHKKVKHDHRILEIYNNIQSNFPNSHGVHSAVTLSWSTFCCNIRTLNRGRKIVDPHKLN